jgi:hypothetical protein
MPAVDTLLLEHLADPANGWSVGEMGVLAEFHCKGATVRPDARTVVTQGGAMRVAAGLAPVPLAYETASANPRLWNHGVMFCLEETRGRGARREVITELGQDVEAIDATERDALVFDLGLGLAVTDFLVRTRDTSLIAALRAAVGTPWLANHALQAAIVRSSPTRVLLTALARIEVTNPIPRPGGVSPEGPHTHLLPDIMRPGRVHDANIPVPAGMLPCLTLYPPHPARDQEGRERSFDAAAHQRYQALLERFGNPVYLGAKRGAMQEESRLSHLGRLIAARQGAFTNGAA